MENKGEAKRRYFVSEIETTKRAVKDLQENLVNSRKGRKILNSENVLGFFGPQKRQRLESLEVGLVEAEVH